MQWPTMSDYQDALQNPRLCFADPDLQRGLPVTDALGLPRPITGGFASVYQVLSGGRKWAVRCFLRHHQDSEQRYAAIGRALSSSRLPYVIGFQYLKQGIRIKGGWYPILKMEWVDGEPLNIYVQKHRSNPQAILDLAGAFARMAADLRSRSIAHGDLQHGNILVVGGQIKLVDYDGMYVPGLHGLPSHEVGHPNYQHPRRSEGDFGPYLDAFSEWVIYVSLTALSVRPDLWDALQIGDEQLLFSQRDFVNPAGSRALRMMDESGDPVLKGLSSTFRQVIMLGDLTQIPPPDASMDPSSLTDAASRGSGGVLATLAKKIWLPLGGSNHKQDTPGAGEANAGPMSALAAGGGSAQAAAGSAQAPTNISNAGPGTPAAASWVQYYLPPAAVKLSPPFSADRALVVGCAALLFGLARFHAAGYLSAQIALWTGISGSVGMVAGLVWRFTVRPEFRKKKVLLSDLRLTRRQARKVESEFRKLERAKNKVLVRQQQSIDNIEARLKDLARSEQEEYSQVDTWLQRYLKEMAERREDIDKAEADELAKAAKSTALPFLSKRASSIFAHYRKKRESLLRQEEKAKVSAQKKKDMIRLRNSRLEQVFHNKLTEVRMNYGTDIGALNTMIGDANSRLLQLREAESNLTRELKLYAEVSFAVYLRRVAFLP